MPSPVRKPLAAEYTITVELADSSMRDGYVSSFHLKFPYASEWKCVVLRSCGVYLPIYTWTLVTNCTKVKNEVMIGLLQLRDENNLLYSLCCESRYLE